MKQQSIGEELIQRRIMGRYELEGLVEVRVDGEVVSEAEMPPKA